MVIFKFLLNRQYEYTGINKNKLETFLKWESNLFTQNYKVSQMHVHPPQHSWALELLFICPNKLNICPYKRLYFCPYELADLLK